MAYETASATGVNDLLDKLRIFALANGFTVDYSGNRTNPGGASQGNGLNALALSKGGLSWVLYHDTTGGSTSDPTPRVRAYTYTGAWTAANGTDAQAGQTTIVAANNLGGPYTAYHFFTDTARNYLHAAVEVVPGRFTHFGIGRLNETGTTSAVPYAFGLSWNFSVGQTESPTSPFHGVPWDCYGQNAARPGTVFRCNSDGVSPRNYEMRYTSAAAIEGAGGFRIASATAGQSCLTEQLIRLAPSALTGRAVLAPAIVLAERTQDVYSIIGTPHDIRIVRIDNMVPGQVITIGADSWKCFPIARKNGGTGVESSGVYGYAYRVVA